MAAACRRAGRTVVAPAIQASRAIQASQTSQASQTGEASGASHTSQASQASEASGASWASGAKLLLFQGGLLSDMALAEEARGEAGMAVRLRRRATELYRRLGALDLAQ